MPWTQLLNVVYIDFQFWDKKADIKKIMATWELIFEYIF